MAIKANITTNKIEVAAQGRQGVQGIQGETGATGATGPAGPGSTWGGIAGTLSDQTDLQTALNLKTNTADVAAVGFSGDLKDMINNPTIQIEDQIFIKKAGEWVARLLNTDEVQNSSTIDSGSGTLTDSLNTLDADKLETGDNVSALANDAGYTSRLNVTQRLVNTASPSAILTTDGTILFDSALVTISIDLPLASVGKVKIPFKDSGCNSSTNNITVNRAGSDTITDSATSQASTTIASSGFSGYFLSDGVDTWYLL